MYINKLISIVVSFIFLSSNLEAVAEVAFPIRINTDGRHLEDSNGVPFTIHADTPWSLIVQLSLTDAAVYLENRRQKGFNAIIVNLIEHQFSDHAPANYNNVAPFTTAGDFSKPNEAYFAHADSVISLAQQKGFLVLLTPSYFGYGGGSEGWWQEIVSNGPSKCYNYGRYVGNRYKAYPNILWMLGGDYNPPAGSQGELNALEMIKGLKETDRTGRLFSYHGSRGTTALDQTAFRTHVNVNAVYTSSTDVYQYCFDAYQDSAMPTFLFEAYYENEHSMTPLSLRKQAYWASTACTVGQAMGNAPLWYLGSSAGASFADNPNVTWKAAMEWPGSLDEQRLRQLIDATNAFRILPDINHQVVTGGFSSGVNTVATGYKSDKSFSLSYVPNTSTLTLSLGWFSGLVTLRWFDPTNASYQTVSGSPFMNSGTRTFATPGNNSSGSKDWVLVATTSAGTNLHSPDNLRILGGGQ